MVEFILKNKKYILAAIMILAAFLILFQLTRADIQHDDAIYSFRGVDYLDYVDSQLQTTPIMWFDEIPWWANLSFHDAPPLVFIIQFIFFKLLGVSVLVAKLPFALAGIGAVFLTYFIAKQLYDEKVALLASLLLAISSFHSWASKIGYLEPIALFFILLTIYLFLKGLKNNKIFIWFGVALGFMLLTKYTVIFILPAIFLYLLARNRKILINKYFIFSIVIAVLIFSPVLFYNFQLLKTRGHFDLQLANIFGQDMSDWPGMAGGGVSPNVLQQSIDVWQQLGVSYSLPLYLALIASLIYLLVNLVFKFKTSKHLLLILILFFATIEFALIGVSDRFLSLYNPFLAIVAAYGLIKFYRFLTNYIVLTNLRIFAYILVLTIIVGVELFYNLNTNIFSQPVGQAGRQYSINRWENNGFNQLESYLIDQNHLKLGNNPHIKKMIDLQPNFSDISGQDIFIYDPNLNWFSTLWYFARWKVYSQIFIVSAVDIAISLGDANWFEFFTEKGANNFYFIRGVSDKSFDVGNRQDVNQRAATALEQLFKNQGAEIFEINNANDELSFRIYKVQLN